MAVRRTQAELTEVEADLAYWQVLSELIPDWLVFGWSNRHSASYLTSGEYGDRVTLQLTGTQRDAIVKAIRTARGLLLDAGSDSLDHVA